MKKQVTFEIGEDIASKAEAIYLSLGMDLEMALGVFMRRTVLENRLPIDLGITAAPVTQSVPDYPIEESAQEAPVVETQQKTRTNNAITKSMAEALWSEFKTYANQGGDIRSISSKVADTTGMNPGSAFIYMNILNNLVSGTPNTRNMKMRDLEYYMTKIKEEFGEDTYGNALESLEQSIPYWDKPTFGYFASHVSDYLKKHKK